jgi:hypothetical protein
MSIKKCTDRKSIDYTRWFPNIMLLGDNFRVVEAKERLTHPWLSNLHLLQNDLINPG